MSCTSISRATSNNPKSMPTRQAWPNSADYTTDSEVSSNEFPAIPQLILPPVSEAWNPNNED